MQSVRLRESARVQDDGHLVTSVMSRMRFAFFLTAGRLLRAGRYSQVRIVEHCGAYEVRKHRRFFAPLLILVGTHLLRLLDTGVRVLPRSEWHARERRIYRDVHGASARSDGDGTLILPHLHGVTLSALLDDPNAVDRTRKRAIELAVAALQRFHQLELTHGDAMADNVMVDVGTDSAHWFDFETVHETGRSTVWRRADDVRALLTTCLLRTAPARRGDTLRLIVDAYADDEVTRVLPTFFTSRVHRALVFHLGQAGLSFRDYREIARLLGERCEARLTPTATRRDPA